MKQKYYYQLGMCTALKYNSLNPVMYESHAEDEDYIKQKMVCEAIVKGTCKNPEECQLLKDAPERFRYKDWNLVDKKLK